MFSGKKTKYLFTDDFLSCYPFPKSCFLVLVSYNISSYTTIETVLLM